MTSIAMEICPMCAMCPRIAGRWLLQVRCNCGACGPKMKTEHEAIGRWNSVVSYMRELSRAGVVAVHAHARPPRGIKRVVRRLIGQCGLGPEHNL